MVMLSACLACLGPDYLRDGMLAKHRTVKPTVFSHVCESTTIIWLSARLSATAFCLTYAPVSHDIWVLACISTAEVRMPTSTRV